MRHAASTCGSPCRPGLGTEGDVCAGDRKEEARWSTVRTKKIGRRRRRSLNRWMIWVDKVVNPAESIGSWKWELFRKPQVCGRMCYSIMTNNLSIWTSRLRLKLTQFHPFIGPMLFPASTMRVFMSGGLWCLFSHLYSFSILQGKEDKYACTCTSPSFIPFSTFGSFGPTAEGLLSRIFYRLSSHTKVPKREAHDSDFHHLSFIRMHSVAINLLENGLLYLFILIDVLFIIM